MLQPNAVVIIRSKVRKYCHALLIVEVSETASTSLFLLSCNPTTCASITPICGCNLLCLSLPVLILSWQQRILFQFIQEPTGSH